MSLPLLSNNNPLLLDTLQTRIAMYPILYIHNKVLL